MKDIEKETPLMNAKEVASLLGIKTQTLWTLVNKGVIPAYRLGERTVRFNRGEVLSSLKSYLKIEK